MPSKRAVSTLFSAVLPLYIETIRTGVARGQLRDVKRVARRVRVLATLAGAEDVIKASDGLLNAAAPSAKSVDTLVTSLRRIQRHDTRRGILIYHPDLLRCTALGERAKRFATGVMVAIDADLVAEHLAGVEQPPAVILVWAGPEGNEAANILARVHADPAFQNTPVVVFDASEVQRLRLLGLGTFECFGDLTAEESDMWACVATLVGFEGVGIEMLPSDERLVWGRLQFNHAIRRTAERHLLAQGPQWAIAAFRIDNAAAIRERGGMGGLRRAVNQLAITLSERCGLEAIIGPLDDQTVAAVVPAHSAVSVAFSMDAVRREVPPITISREVVLKPLISGCVVHAGTVNVPTAMREVDTLLAQCRPADFTLRTLQLSDEIRDAVLLVEDDPVFAALVEHAIEPLGLRMVHATDVRQALEITRAVARMPFCLMILDVNLPDGSGFEVLDEVRSDVRMRDVPTIFASTMGTERQMLMGLELGADDYLIKPVSPPLLTAKIRAVLARGIRGTTPG